jgi:hypothetical protein
MAEDQHTSDQSARPLPECLTRLLIDPEKQFPRASVDDANPSAFERMLWWVKVATFDAISVIFGAALKIAGMWP